MEPNIKLTIELVPDTVHGANLRSRLPASDWNIIRKYCYKQAGNKCEVCGGEGRAHLVEAHEVWEGH